MKYAAILSMAMLMAGCAPTVEDRCKTVMENISKEMGTQFNQESYESCVRMSTSNPDYAPEDNYKLFDLEGKYN